MKHYLRFGVRARSHCDRALSPNTVVNRPTIEPFKNIESRVFMNLNHKVLRSHKFRTNLSR
ncbi:hypothetical protein LC586_13605 [Nostoc sp. CHAB 5714]|uniref:Uncharacterized protein n=1 Tax=Nostoc favosum CHAB5714 TaxID=2780399 RepID=A0ABS8I7T5_9NOSO|nr:hypothetical protein [Nostoc favosum CHAB5714]